MNALRRYAERLDAMSLRERALIFVAGALMFVGIFKVALIDPQLSRQRDLSRTVGQQRIEIQATQRQIQAMAIEQRQDPNQALRERIEVLNREVAAIERQVREQGLRFTSPERMRGTLEQLLRGRSGLRIVELKTLPAAPVGGGVADESAKVFRHSVELTLEGPYLDIFQYLADLEGLPSQLHWARAELAGAFPNSTLKLRVYTLSVDRAWMVV